MADIDFDDYGASPRITGGQVQKLIHLAGAACSIALVVGVGLWGYRLAVRDVSGIPVIRAAEGPMRVAPSNPGGDIADHQGMAVNVIAAIGGAGEMPQEIVLAPMPVELASDDAPGLSPMDPMEVAAAAPPPEAALPLRVQTDEVPLADDMAVADLGVATLASPSVPVLPDEAPVASTDDAVAMALAEALGQDVAALEPMEDTAPAAEPAPVVASGEGVARSPRPMARPSGAMVASDVTEVSASLPVGSEIDPATLAAGTRLVQLGAFDSPELARGEWRKLSGRFGDLMTGKSVVIQAAQSGGRTFYRLRAYGFGGEDDARRFCAALLAEDAACIPVAHR